MKAQELYEKETGDIAPNNQIAYHEWYIRYVKWLERRVEFQIKTGKDKQLHNDKILSAYLTRNKC